MSRLTNKLANARAIFSLTFRNRYEARWIEALGTTNIDRFRHRSTVAIPVSGPLGLNRIKLSNEFFYSFLADSYNQNWLIPVLAEFRAKKGWSFQLYYMIRSRRGLDPLARDRHFPAHLSQAHEQERYISDGVRAGRQVTALGRMIS